MKNLQSTAQRQLKEHVEAIERMQEEQKAIGSDIKDRYLVAKKQGFDVKILRKILALRKKSEAEREEEQALIDTYMGALDGTPLGSYGERQRERELEPTH